MSRREKIAALLREGLPVNEVARAVGVSPPTVCYHARKLGLPRSEKYSRRYDWEEIRRYYDAGHTLSECQAEFGFSTAAWHGAVKRGDVVARPSRKPLQQMLVANSPHGRWILKRRLLEAGLKEQRCEECGLEEWRGRPLSLALHHANGDGRDNRLENLALLCPNCHSQTDTFGVRNRKRSAAAA